MGAYYTRRSRWWRFWLDWLQWYGPAWLARRIPNWGLYEQKSEFKEGEKILFYSSSHGDKW